MADNRWEPKAKKVAQVNTITPTASNNATYTVTINTKDITYTADASATVAEITAGLVALLNASTEPEFAEVTWADGTTVLTGTADTAGKPFTQTSSSSAGALTTSTTTANVSPSDFADADNWSAGTTPATGEDVYIDNSDVDILWNLGSLSAQTLATLTIANSFTGVIGLAEYDTDSTEYRQYRPTYLAIGITALRIGDETGEGSGRIKINTGSVQTAIQQFNAGSPEDDNLEAVIWKGTHASNTVNVFGGSFGAAVFGGETATIATLQVGSPGSSGGLEADVRCGTGVTLTTITQLSGELETNSAATTITVTGGSYRHGAGAVTTLTVRAASVAYAGTGTIGTLNMATGGVIDFSEDMRARTVSVCDVWGPCAISDPGQTVTWSAGIDFQQLNPFRDCSIDVGTHRRLTPGAVA